MKFIKYIHVKMLLAIMAIAMTVTATPVFAGNTQSVDVDIEVPQLLELYWDPADSGDSVQLTGLNKIAATKLLDGYIDKVDGGSLIVSTNVWWDLTVEADNDFFSGGSGTKPSSDVYVDTDVANTYSYRLNGLIPVILYSGRPPDISNHDIYYKIMLNAADTPGIYSLNLTYTLIKN